MKERACNKKRKKKGQYRSDNYTSRGNCSCYIMTVNFIDIGGSKFSLSCCYK